MQANDLRTSGRVPYTVGKPYRPSITRSGPLVNGVSRLRINPTQNALISFAGSTSIRSSRGFPMQANDLRTSGKVPYTVGKPYYPSITRSGPLVNGVLRLRKNGGDGALRRYMQLHGVKVIRRLSRIPSASQRLANLRLGSLHCRRAVPSVNYPLRASG